MFRIKLGQSHDFWWSKEFDFNYVSNYNLIRNKIFTRNGKLIER